MRTFLSIGLAIGFYSVAAAQTLPKFIPRVGADSTNNGAGINTTLYNPTTHGGTINATNVLRIPPLLQTTDTGGYLQLLMHRDLDTTLFADPHILFNPTNNAFYGNGLGLTNVNVSTNTWGNAVVPFNRGKILLTNMAGNLTITGISGFQNDVLNEVYIRLNPDGADRVLAVPADWRVGTNSTPVGAFTNATTATIANGSRAWLLVECFVGIETNAFLLPAY